MYRVAANCLGYLSRYWRTSINCSEQSSLSKLQDILETSFVNVVQDKLELEQRRVPLYVLHDDNDGSVVQLIVNRRIFTSNGPSGIRCRGEVKPGSLEELLSSRS